MNYCTQAQLIELYGETVLAQLTDDNRPAKQINPVLIDRALEDADSEIDLHLQGRYPLPLLTVPRVLVRIAGSIAYANLHKNLGENHPALRAAEHSRRMLKGISKGELSIGLDVAGDVVPVADNVQISGGRNDFAQGGW
ncbi:DUF1320 domain-containing protein [Pseudomonas sp. F1_0610]|uniref:gp436 family protein n=1 Tax=Pseudomonas sp. F1_0610 TaxID=3114284 RepID=UPI0039C3D9B4